MIKFQDTFFFSNSFLEHAWIMNMLLTHDSIEGIYKFYFPRGIFIHWLNTKQQTSELLIINLTLKKLEEKGSISTDVAVKVEISF